MSTNYGRHVSNKKTPQTQQLFGADQVENNAGGYVFKISNEQLLERFILIGSEGGTFYVSEKNLTVDNAKAIIKMIQNDGLKVLEAVKTLVTRAPKRDPAIFVLALATTYGNQEVKNEAYKLIKSICKTATHLFTFAQNIQDLRGWSRGLRRGVADFYLSKTPDQVAYQMVKYRQRNGWTHKDIIKLTHPATESFHMNELFKYAIGKADPTPVGLVRAFEHAQSITDGKSLVKLIQDDKLTWEMIPTASLKDASVLEALLEHMPLTAMIRNLNRMTKAGLFDSNLSPSTKLVVSRLTNVDLLKKAGVHPINLLNSLAVYAQGRGDKGSMTWTPNQKIVDALEEAFELSFQTQEATGKNILLAVDVSGSMHGTNINNMALNAKQIAAALSLTFVKSEPNVDLIWFDTNAYKPSTGKRSSYEEVLNNTPNGGGTDCSQVYKVAIASKQKYDAIITLTDSETWAGDTHAVQLMERYQKGVNPNCKHIVVGMVANNYSVLTDKDPNVLHVAGFDSAIPQLITNFISGR